MTEGYLLKQFKCPKCTAIETVSAYVTDISHTHPVNHEYGIVYPLEYLGAIKKSLRGTKVPFYSPPAIPSTPTEENDTTVLLPQENKVGVYEPVTEETPGAIIDRMVSDKYEDMIRVSQAANGIFPSENTDTDMPVRDLTRSDDE